MSPNWILVDRRNFSLGLAATFAPRLAYAETYPERTIRVVVPFSPGGVIDIATRIISAKLGAKLGAAVIIDNKPGATGFIGSAFVAKSPPDGYTLVAASSTTHALAPQLYDDIPYDPIKDFEPISEFMSAPNVMLVPASLPVTSVSEFVALAKQQPGKLNFASYGVGSTAYVAAELLQLLSGIKLSHIPYKGSGPILVDMMGSAVKLELFFDSIISSMPYVKAGNLKALAVTSKARVRQLPDVPALAETYPEFEVAGWCGLEAPAKTPNAYIDRLYAALADVMADPEVQSRLVDLGATPMCTTPKQFAAEITEQNSRWKRFVEKMAIPRQQL